MGIIVFIVAIASFVYNISNLSSLQSLPAKVAVALLSFFLPVSVLISAFFFLTNRR